MRKKNYLNTRKIFIWPKPKGKVYENNWDAKDIPTLMNRIKKYPKEIKLT